MPNESYHTISSPMSEVCSSIRQLSRDFFESELVILLGVAIIVLAINFAIHTAMIDYTDRVAVAMANGYEECYVTDHSESVWMKAH